MIVISSTTLRARSIRQPYYCRTNQRRAHRVLAASSVGRRLVSEIEVGNLFDAITPGMHQDMPLAVQQPHAHRAPLLYAGPFSRATAGINHCAPDRKAEYRGERVCVSLCARVFVCPRSCLRNYASDLRQFLCMLPTTVARSSSGGVVIRYVLPVLWMTSYLLISQGCSTSPPS